MRRKAYGLPFLEFSKPWNVNFNDVVVSQDDLRPPGGAEAMNPRYLSRDNRVIGRHYFDFAGPCKQVSGTIFQTLRSEIGLDALVNDRGVLDGDRHHDRFANKFVHKSCGR